MTGFVRGQRVKMTHQGIVALGSYNAPNKRKMYRHDEHLRGTVTSVDEYVHVRLDGRRQSQSYHLSFWESAE